MAINVIDIKYNKAARNTIHEFICDTDADFALLPKCDPGSIAVSVATGAVYVVNASGSWVEFGVSIVSYVPGLYQAGAIAIYEEEGAEAIEGMMIKSWNDLLAEGIIHVDNGVVYSNFDLEDTWENASSDALAGDLMLPSDGSVTKLGDCREWHDENNERHYEGRVAFGSCYALTGIIIPDSIADISDYAFAYCENLTRAALPNSVISIGINAFVECSGLISFAIPNSVTSIGKGAFGMCSSLTSITIPNSVTSIDDYTFECCRELTGITIPDSIITIGYTAFRQCDALTSIVIPDSVTSIGNCVFIDCDNLTNITISNSVTSIGEGAFQNCTNLSSITFDGTVEEWNAIELGYHWRHNAPVTYAQCSDGQASFR